MSADEHRKPGRSFDHPDRPLGEDAIESAPEIGANIEAGVYGRAAVGDARGPGLADRAKAVSVLRKAEEFMATNNPSPRTPAGMRRALELAAGRVGLTIQEYEDIVRADPELQELERKVLAANAR